jgi:DNA helicase II / ATP-dependent DNA helicase PcrA
MPLQNLNQEQYKSATSKSGYNLTIASAGTGKTSTIVGRIAHLLQNNIPPQEILLLTFTNKAASEMISRVANYFTQEIASKIVAGTFHSVSYKLMKAMNMNVALKRPSELKTLFKSLYEKRIFPNNGETTPYDGGYLYELYSLYLNSSNGEDFETWICERNIAHKPYVLIYQDLFDEFDILKREYGYVNFDDLLLQMLKIQEENKFHFYEILVDEYQDTNPLQGKLLEGFRSKSLFCVGDYDQSIYAFNGSDIGIISSFSTRYEGSSIHTLTKNYRSTKPILDLANRVINFNERIYDKKLEVVRTESLQNPMLLSFDELYGQYEYIAQNIQKSSTTHSEIAVIYRNNSSADGIEANLRDLGIKSKRKGGHSFFDSREIKLVLDMLILLTNSNDMMAFIHTIEYGKNIGKSVAKDIFDALIFLGDGDLYKGLVHPNNEKTPYKSTKTSNIQLGLFDDFIEMGSLQNLKIVSLVKIFLGIHF